MIDPVTAITDFTDSVFTEVSNSINSQIDSLLDACETDSDIAWLISCFAKHFDRYSTTRSSIRGVEFKCDNEIGHWTDGKWHGSCTFLTNISYSSAETYNEVRFLYDDHMVDAYFCADETGELVPTSIRSDVPIQLMLPETEAFCEWVRWIIEHEYLEYEIELDNSEIASMAKTVICEFADFIEDHCQRAISEVSLELEDRYN